MSTITFKIFFYKTISNSILFVEIMRGTGNLLRFQEIYRLLISDLKDIVVNNETPPTPLI
jgi:hypothetical protein